MYLLEQGKKIGLILIFLCGISAFAKNPRPLTDPSQLVQPTQWNFKEEVVRVKGAKVVIADYKLIRKDFPELREKDNDEIDQWLIQHTAYVSIPQSTLGTRRMLNSPMDLDQDDHSNAYRPNQYGRALVFHAGNGLIDVKGSGTLNPGPDGHKNGLASLEEGLREFMVEKLVSTVFDHEKAPHKTIGTYAVIDPGYSVYDFNLPEEERSKRGHVAGGLILRQAHVRSDLPGALLPSEKTFEIEKRLRKYGLSGAGAFDGVDKDYDMINIQGSADGDVIDFASFVAFNRYHRKIREFWQTATLLPKEKCKLGGILMDPERPVVFTDKSGEIREILNFEDHQPDPKLLVPLEMWGRQYLYTGQQTSEGSPIYDSYEIPARLTHDWAAAYKEGKISRENITEWIKGMLHHTWNTWEYRESLAHLTGQGCELGPVATEHAGISNESEKPGDCPRNR